MSPFQHSSKAAARRPAFALSGQTGSAKLARTAMLAALYVLLGLFSLKLGNLKLSFASLPVTLGALLFGPWAAAAVALVGEFLNQMLKHGFTATTPLWLIPPMIRGIVIGLAARRMKKERPLEERPAALYAAVLSAALLTTLCNTALIALDSLIYGYYSAAYVFSSLLLRLGVGLLTAAIIATICLPLVKLLRRQR